MVSKHPFSMSFLLLPAAAVHAVFLGLTGTSAFAGTISVTATPPTEGIIDFFAPESVNTRTTVRWRDGDGDTDAGQTFVVPGDQDYVLTAITFRLQSANGGASNLPIVVDLFSYAGGASEADNPNHTEFTSLWRDTATLPAGLTADGAPENDQYVTIDLTDTIPAAQRVLEAGAQYAWLIGSNSEDTSGTDDNAFAIRASSLAGSLDPTTQQVRRDFTDFDVLQGDGNRALLSDPIDRVRDDRDHLFHIHALPALKATDIEKNGSMVTIEWISGLDGPFEVVAGDGDALATGVFPEVAASGVFGDSATFAIPAPLVTEPAVFFRVTD